MEETGKAGRGKRAGVARIESKPVSGKARSGTGGDRVTSAKISTKRPSGARPQPDGVVREEWIRVAAYYRAERRGFAPGHDLEDWFAAEAGLASRATPTRVARARKGDVRAGL